MQTKLYTVQLAVVGGGPAGVTAAIAAARQGLATLLVTNRPVLGGNSSSEIRVWARGAVGAGNLFAEEMGIWGELKLENLYRNPEGNPVFWDEVLLDAVLAEPNLTLLFNTQVDTLQRDGCRVCAVEGTQQGSEKRIRVEAGWFLDATGDGTLGALAGLPYYLGEQLVTPGQPPRPPFELLGSSLLFYTQKTDRPVAFHAPAYAWPRQKVEALLQGGGRIVEPAMSGSDCWWFELGGRQDTIGEDGDIALELRRLVLGVWDYIKNSGRFDADSYTLSWIGSIPGKRESRRMATDYLLRGADVLQGRTFEDGAFYGGWYLDVHPAGGMLDAHAPNCVQTPVPVYAIPLRCLYNSRVENLLFAGRCIGTERSAFFSTRVMDTCALSGQAAAMLAVACAAWHTVPGQMTRAQVDRLRQQLLREDLFVPGLAAKDGTDLALKAELEVTSVHDGRPGPRTGRMDLAEGGFVTFPGVQGTALLPVSLHTPQTLHGALYMAPLPNRLCPGEKIRDYRWELPAGDHTLPIQAQAGGFCTLVLEAAPGAGLPLCQAQRTGFVCGKKGSPVWGEPMLEYQMPQRLYGAEQLVNGYARPWGGANQWCAAPGDPQPAVTLRWPQPQALRELRLYLDPELCAERPSSHAAQWQDSHQLAFYRQMPAQLARDMAVEVLREGGWEPVWQGKDNRKRLVTVALPEGKKSRALRIRFIRTWGDRPVGVFAVNVS